MYSVANKCFYDNGMQNHHQKDIIVQIHVVKPDRSKDVGVLVLCYVEDPYIFFLDVKLKINSGVIEDFTNGLIILILQIQ